MEQVKLQETISNHKKWLQNEVSGERANLSYADLSSANLSYADLRSANLRYANLRYANLSYADLSYADLRSADLRYANLSYADLSYANLSYADLSSANLRSANLRYANLSYADLRYADLSSANLSYADLQETVYENINWLAFIGIVPMSDGKIRAYKLVNALGEGIFRGGINYLKGQRFEVEEVDTDQNIQCSYGINLATFSWCIFNRQSESDRLFLMEFNVEDTVCPFGSDGKFRVKKCHEIGECDWKGNLIGLYEEEKTDEC